MIPKRLIPKVVDNDPFDRVHSSARQARPVDCRWPWCQPTTSGPQRCERAKDRGLRWAEMAPWVRYRACPMRKASRFTPRLPRRPFRPIKWVNINDLWYYPIPHNPASGLRKTANGSAGTPDRPPNQSLAIEVAKCERLPGVPIQVGDCVMPKVILGILAVVAVAGWAIAIVFLNKSGDLGGKLETSEAVRAKLAEDLESARKDLEKYLESAGRLDEIGQQVSAAEDQVAALDGQLQAARQELAAVKNETEAGKVELATVESKLRERKAQVSGIEQEIELAGTELKRLHTEAEGLRQKAEGAQTGLLVERQPPPQAASEAEPSVAEPKETDRIAEARRRFQIVDRNGDGRLDQFEFRLNSVKLMGLIDANRDGFITRDETLLSSEQFGLFDFDGDGKISPMEFVDTRTFRTIDANQQGFITFEEYLAFNQATVK